MRLWVYLTLLVNGIVLAAFVGYGTYSATEQVDHQSTLIHRDTLNLAQSVAAGSANDILTDAFDRIENRLMRQVMISSVEEILIVDRNGLLVSRVRRTPSGHAEAVYDPLPAPLDLQQMEHQTETHYTRLIPIERGDTVGWVRVTSNLAVLQEMRLHIWENTIVASLLTMTLLAYLLRRVGKTLEASSQFAADLIHQRGSTINDQSRIFEIHQLKSALNGVSQALAQQFQALTESETRKGAMLESSLDCLITIDEHGIITDFNPAAETTFGYPRSEVIGQRMSDIVVPHALREAHERGLQHYLQTGHGPVIRTRIEITALRRDGSEFPVELSIVPFEIAGENYFLGSLRDISARKALEAEQQRISAVLHQTVSDLAAQQFALDEHAIVSIADLQGNITYVNEKFLTISQYSLDELMGRNHRMLKSGLHDAAFYEEIWTTITAGKPWHGEIANRRKDGSIYWLAATIVPMLGDDDLPYQYISIRTDITEQKNNERQLELYRQDLEQSVERYKESELNLSIARAREVAVGSQIQRTLLFGDVPARVGPLTIAVHTEPSMGIDGDFYEFFGHSAHVCDLTIGDVMGKGIHAALVGAAVKQQINKVLARQLSTHAESGQLPAPVNLINRLHHGITPRLIELETFVTLAYFRFDLANHSATFVDAGHTSAILSRAEGVRLLNGDNMPLGVMESETYQQHDIELRAGDLIFLYSDGMTEARSPEDEEYGIERLMALVQTLHNARIPTQVVVQAVRTALRDFEHHVALRDDRTCVALQINADAGSHPAQELALPWRLDQLAPLRQALAALLLDADVAAEVGDAITLGAFEAATNVIRHVTPPLDDSTLHCRMRDSGAAIDIDLYYLGEPFSPQAIEPDFSGGKEGGFGLYIIQSSFDEVIYDAPAPGVCRIHLSRSKGSTS